MEFFMKRVKKNKFDEYSSWTNTVHDYVLTASFLEIIKTCYVIFKEMKDTYYLLTLSSLINEQAIINLQSRTFH